MGLSSLTPHLVCLLSVTSRATARRTRTITLLRSLADPGGGFDAPKPKCPPDRRSGGSSDCVTGSPASIRSLRSNLRTPSPSPTSMRSTPPSHEITQKYTKETANKKEEEKEKAALAQRIVFPPTPPPDDVKGNPFAEMNVQAFPINVPPPSAPVPMPNAQVQLPDTPPITPESSAPIKDRNREAALLRSLFPNIPSDVLRTAQAVSVSAEGLGMTFEGVVLETDGARTLYVDGGKAEGVSLRESIVALLDLASERLECSALVIALRRTHPALGALLHALMYVGGAVVTRPAYEPAKEWVLVGVEV